MSRVVTALASRWRQCRDLLALLCTFAARAAFKLRGWTAPSASARRHELLDAALQGLSVARDNKALVVARDGIIININPLASQLCGRSQDGLIGKSVTLELFGESSAPHSGAAIQRWETVLKTASGKPVPVEISRQPLGTRLLGVEVYAIRDLRDRREIADERERQMRALQQRDEEIRAQNLRFEMALTSMTQGLCVFDAQQRLVICNGPYLQMYGFSPDAVKPGTTLGEILELRIANGLHAGHASQEFLDERLAAVAAGVAAIAVHHLPDGRVIEVAHHPIAGGGWVATHEDVTERRRMAAALAQSNRELAGQNELLRQHEGELKAQNIKFDAALENMLQGLAMFDVEQRLVVCNRLYARMYGLSPEQVKPGTTVRQIFDYRLANGHYHVKDSDGFVDSWAGDFGQSSARIQELADGRIVSVMRRQTEGGGRVVTHEDITDRQRLSAQLAEQNGRLREQEDKLQVKNLQLDAALNNMAQGLAMFDADLRIVVANDRYAAMYGLTPEQVEPGTSLRQIVEYRIANGHLPGRSVDDVMNGMLRRVTGDKTSHYTVTTEDGRYITVSAQPIATGWTVTTHHDITERRRSEAKIAHMALHDALTDLPNRALLGERLEYALARVNRGEIVAVHLLDLDHFKKVNDTLGHAAGDKLLMVVADRLRALVRETDTVCRLGGDEFAILQVAIAQPADATTLVQRVIEAVSAPYEIDGQQIVIGTSVGIAVGPADGVTSDHLMRNADLALYRAKGDGRGAFRFFEPAMDAQMQARRAMESDLRLALAAGQFELYYQPVVNLEHNKISGFEALIRWHHPEKGMIPPGTFIPVAEEIGFIVPLGAWVIRQACANAAAWPDHLTVAVNLSAVQFRSPGLLQTVVGALAASGLPAHRLEIEITESVLMQDNEATLATLNRLRELGAKIAMDDFGTGYSSLSYLQSFPFDKIKIDRSFVKDITEGVSSLNIVRAVAALAQGLGMVTTAEGVETKEQLDVIKSEGCTEMQGFFFSKAIPAREIEQLLLADRKDGGQQDSNAA